MLFRSCLAASALATLAYAQSSTSVSDEPVVSVLAIGAAGDQAHLYGSVVNNDATATTLKIGCDLKPGSEDTVCNLFSGFTVTQGPSTFAAGYEYGGGTMTLGCKLTGTTTGSCSQTLVRPTDDMDPYISGDGSMTPTLVTGSNGLVTQSTTTTFAASDMTYFPVTITAGALKTEGESESATGSSTSGASSSSGSAQPTAGSGDAGQLMVKASSVLVGLVSMVVMVL